MEFFEFVFIFSLTVLLPIVILRTVLEFKRSKLEAARGLGDGEGITAGELKRMLAEVVREANAPLVERIEALERDDEALPAVHDDPYSDEELDLENEAEKTLGRRLRG